ncbi:phosphomannomutase/phosphoglucomutase, partial [Gammaproteobacteria bacterium]|nr:phosphomannomutase/phosphoglucomutase [Gammaproteobacteria bacterium]
MNITSSIFRENDIRGTYPEQINENTIKLVAYAIARKCKKHEINSIAVGRDGRLSGPSLLESFCDGLLEAGIHVNNIGLVTSPLLYFAAKKEESKSGIMITGSHNPKNHNGIKMVIDDKPVSGTEIFDLIRNSEDFGKKGEIKYTDIKELYLEEVSKNIFVQKPEELKIVLDCGNGAAGCIAPDLFKKLGFSVIELFSEVDGNFPNHHPDPGKLENLKDLITEVEKSNADVGLAFDGDGDRVGLVTNIGEVIFPD